MSVIRINKTNNFTVMSNYHFKEKGMSLKAKGLLSLMLSLPDDWDYSISGLVSLSKDGKDSVMSALSELEKFGYLIRNRTINSKGQFSGIEYNIFEQPQKEIPIAEKQNSEKQNAENPPQLNTKLIKNLNNKNIKESNTKYDEILENIFNNDLKQLYKDYIEMRESIKAPQYCSLHKNNYEPVFEREIECIECGKLFKVPSSNSRSCRCEKCQHEATLKKYAKYNSKRNV